MNMNHLENAYKPPQHILGLVIRSRTRIYVSYVLPNILELLIYIVQIVADCAVSFQHFKSHQPHFGWASLSLILIPPIVSCVLVLSSQSQWIDPKQHGTRVKFVCMQVSQMILFPFFVIYRFAKLVFWSIEALFHDDDDEERMECLAKAEECSTCELYRLIQAYGQSAPQIILQMYHMLTQDLFRNFQTTNAQAISLTFSAIDLAVITTIYQRFASQKQVGRQYPWATAQQKQKNSLKMQKNKYFQEEYMCKKHHNSQRTLNKFPESDKIMENFKARNQDMVADGSQESLVYVSGPINHTVQVHGFNELENEQLALLATHLTDDDKIKTNPISHSKIEELPETVDEFDTVPKTPPPPLPPKILQVLNAHGTNGNSPQLRTQTSNQSSSETNKRRSNALSQLETFKDMLLMNAQLYIKENVPRPPKILIKRVEDNSSHNQYNSTKPPQDEVDFYLPTPTKIINGLQQDDFAAKTVAFFGWIAFVLMRLLSLSTFSVFFPKAFFIVVGVHYVIMLACLFLESRFKGKLNRILFHFLLAYVYIYVLVEFRVKFKHVRVWFIGYLLLSLAENLTMTMMWYNREEFESWWFEFIYECIIYSGILFVATIIVYYFILKPKDLVFLVEDEEQIAHK